MMEIRFIEFFLILNKKNITLSINHVYYAVFYVDDVCVNVFLPNFFSMCTVYIIYPLRLIYISTSLFNVFHPRRLFSRVFSLLLCFLQYSFTLSV